MWDNGIIGATESRIYVYDLQQEGDVWKTRQATAI